MLPPSWFCVASGLGWGQEAMVKSGRDLIVTEFPPFCQVWSLTHTVPAAEQVELGFLIKVVFSISWILISQCSFFFSFFLSLNISLFL